MSTSRPRPRPAAPGRAVVRVMCERRPTRAMNRRCAGRFAPAQRSRWTEPQLSGNAQETTRDRRRVDSGESVADMVVRRRSRIPTVGWPVIVDGEADARANRPTTTVRESPFSQRAKTCETSATEANRGASTSPSARATRYCRAPGTLIPQPWANIESRNSPISKTEGVAHPGQLTEPSAAMYTVSIVGGPDAACAFRSSVNAAITRCAIATASCDCNRTPRRMRLPIG